MTTNLIGLNTEQSQQLAGSLNKLLANYHVFYMNTRGYHWNIKGKEFFELHAKFEEIYTDLQTKLDEVAERILTLGEQPLHSFTSYLAESDIQEHTNATDGHSTMRGLVDGFSTLISQQRNVLALASETGDEGTAAQMSDYIREQEKLIWMLNAWLQ
ncbi:Dps family protein [Vibrio zhugei]|uniref:Dps family protein n=1 Tax=Vibrio zhugei TaxID=2479546 RepID=A0ABV7CEA8_9VIBR|nr:Dps family protein [Vibrio zhugei]